MDVGERRARGVARWAVAAAAGFWLHHRFYAEGAFYRNAIDSAFSEPTTPTKVLMMLGGLLVALALPVALADWRAERRFRRAVRETHRRRFLSTYEPYAGPEGKGVRFSGPEGEVLVLKPRGGFGEPRVAELPARPTGVPVETNGAPSAGRGPSPRDDASGEQASTGAQA